MCVCMHNFKNRKKGESLGRSKAKAHDAPIEGLFGLRLRGKGGNN